MPPPDAPLSPEQMTAAFARVADARYAIGILESCGLAPVTTSIETVTDERGDVALVILRIEIEGEARDRVLAAISGGHGVPVTDTRPTPAPSARVA